MEKACCRYWNLCFWTKLLNWDTLNAKRPVSLIVLCYFVWVCFIYVYFIHLALIFCFFFCSFILFVIYFTFFRFFVFFFFFTQLAWTTGNLFSDWFPLRDSPDIWSQYELVIESVNMQLAHFIQSDCDKLLFVFIVEPWERKIT
jgi:hypothetical protein